jgi:uncharacterized protein (TIGR02001 family)
MKGLLALALLSSAAPVFAQETAAPTSEITPSASVALVSDYRFRGVSLSDEDVAIQGGITVNHSSGFYIGTWGSSIAGGTTYGHTEVDLFAGYGHELAPGTSVDVGLLYYVYPNGHGASDYFEPYASIKTTIGPATAKFGAAYAWDQAATGHDDNIYLFTDLGMGIPDSPVSLNAHLGYTNGSLSLGQGDYWDWAVGADFALGHGITAGVKYVDSNLPSAHTTDSAVVFSIGAAF